MKNDISAQYSFSDARLHKTEYRNMSIGALIRMMIERELEEEDRNADAEEGT